jgi:hypothetical protein
MAHPKDPETNPAWQTIRLYQGSYILIRNDILIIKSAFIRQA